MYAYVFTTSVSHDIMMKTVHVNIEKQECYQ